VTPMPSIRRLCTMYKRTVTRVSATCAQTVDAWNAHGAKYGSIADEYSPILSPPLRLQTCSFRMLTGLTISRSREVSGSAEVLWEAVNRT
jgi:hypothetical protein